MDREDSPSEQEGPLARGLAIGRYVVLALVGRGAMGDVYAAHDPELNRKVAIKVIRPRKGQDTSDEDRLQLMREAQSIARLSHPNVVVIHDVGSFRDTVFIAMEFVDGHTVRYWANAQPRSWREVLKIFEAAGRGLAAAHAKELVHRDFKPDNIMIGADGRVRVMDFGLARTIDGDGAPLPGDQQWLPAPVAPINDRADEDLNSTRRISLTCASWPDHDPPPSATAPISIRDSGRTLGGTPAYMAPEQFQARTADARADQFSFCVALYEALYTTGPFQGRTWSELTANVTAGKVREAPLPSSVPLWIRKVLLRGLQVDPDDRWPSMEALLSALDEDAIRLAEIDEWLTAQEIR